MFSSYYKKKILARQIATALSADRRKCRKNFVCVNQNDITTKRQQKARDERQITRH